MEKNSEYIKEQFRKLLHAHDLSPLEYRDAISVDGGFPAFVGRYFPSEQKQAAGTYELFVLLNDENRLEEQFAGLGNNDKEAIDAVFVQFVDGMFHPILAASGLGDGSKYVVRENWKCADGQKLKVWTGTVTYRSSLEAELIMPPNMLDPIRQALATTSIRSGLSWVSLYLFRDRKQMPFGSVKLNNEEWAEAIDAFTSLGWPTIDGFYSVRSFLMIEK